MQKAHFNVMFGIVHGMSVTKTFFVGKTNHASVLPGNNIQPPLITIRSTGTTSEKKNTLVPFDGTVCLDCLHRLRQVL